MNGAMVQVSVVVPFRNAAHFLPACLDALAAQEYPPAEYILVDNGSTDGGAELVQRFAGGHLEMKIKLIAETKRGPAAARNCGVRNAVGAWIAFTDADCIPSPRWLRDIVVAVNRYQGVGAFAGCIKPATPKNRSEKLSALFTLPANRSEEEHYRYTLVSGGFPTANLAVDRRLFEKVGGFDERLFFGEDHTLCARIYQEGRSIVTLTGATIYHQHRTNLKGFCKQAYGFGEFHARGLKELVPGALILALPLFCRTRIGGGWRIWIDINQADKKTFCAVGVGLLWPPFWLLTLLYLFYLCYFIHRRGRKLALDVSWAETPLLAALLILKSAAITVGRLVGSYRYRVLCL